MHGFVRALRPQPVGQERAGVRRARSPPAASTSGRSLRDSRRSPSSRSAWPPAAPTCSTTPATSSPTACTRSSATDPSPSGVVLASRSPTAPAPCCIVAALAIGFATAREPRHHARSPTSSLTTAYSFWLKHQPVLDIVAVAAGFVLRAIAGAAATDLPISEWFFIVTSFGALLVVVGKREGEMHALGDRAATVRATLGAYTPEFLRYLRAVATGVVLVAYCLWAFESRLAPAPTGATWFKLSIVPFAIAIFQYGLHPRAGRRREPRGGPDLRPGDPHRRAPSGRSSTAMPSTAPDRPPGPALRRRRAAAAGAAPRATAGRWWPSRPRRVDLRPLARRRRRPRASSPGASAAATATAPRTPAAAWSTPPASATSTSTRPPASCGPRPAPASTRSCASSCPAAGSCRSPPAPAT